MTIEIIDTNRNELAFFGRLQQSLSDHRILLIPLALYAAAYEVLHITHPETGAAHLFKGVGLIYLTFIPMLLLGLSLMCFYHVVRYVKPESPTRALLSELKTFLSSPARLANGIPALFIVSVLAFVFSDVQSNILTLQPDTWDQTFSEWDQYIHFGKQPWQWVQPFLGYAPITSLINVNYNLWFFMMMIFLIYFGFAEKTNILRTRFFLSFMGIWIVSGNILAVWLASAGPCYFGRLGLAPDPYAAQMDYLRHANEILPVWAVNLQDMLWAGHLQSIEGSVVSAMPSLHNGSALLFALAAFQVSNFWGRIVAAHAALIYVGSFHLGWHYAIDSYVAWAVTLAIWFASAPLAKWWHQKMEPLEN